MAALLRNQQTLAYEEYASAVLISCALPSKALSGLVVTE